MSEWVNVDIGDEITMPVGIMVEKRTHNGKTQFRNPTIMSVCNPAYLTLFPTIPEPQETKRKENNNEQATN